VVFFMSTRYSLVSPHSKIVPKQNRESCVLSSCYQSDNEFARYGCTLSDLGVGDQRVIVHLSCMDGIEKAIWRGPRFNYR